MSFYNHHIYSAHDMRRFLINLQKRQNICLFSDRYIAHRQDEILIWNGDINREILAK